MSTVTRKAPKVKAAPVVTLALAINHQVYSVEPIAPGEDNIRAFRLVKHSGDSAVYDIAQGRDGVNRCDCPDYECRHVGTLGQCKHLTAATQMGLIDPPAWTGPAPRQYPEPEDFATLAPVNSARTELNPAPAVETSEGFADELADAVGLPVLDTPADAEPDPLAAWVRPARKSFLRVLEAAPRPVKLPALADGQYDLASLVSGQAALLRGQGSAPFALMADHLEALAASIRATGAKSVADVQDRLASMEDDRLGAIEARGFDRGYAEGIADRCCC